MFYDMLGEAEQLHGTIRALDKTNRSGIADEFADNPASSNYRQLRCSRFSVSVSSPPILMLLNGDDLSIAFSSRP